jgi:putative acyl-CoA dehydrogenase
MFDSSSAIYTCPLAMTDGAAKVLEEIGRTQELKSAFERLTSRDPQKFWTSGQWVRDGYGALISKR